MLQQLGTLILDEADLLLSYGYEDDLRQLEPLVRKGLGLAEADYGMYRLRNKSGCCPNPVGVKAAVDL